ncbi:MAG: AAA family ATPase, partial [Methanocorpusculum sp.]|nr:AAA family ATPase [Methanocorpusculum sp.]
MLSDVTQITIKGYRSLEQTSIPLHRINILIGANGSGKSNFISLFDLLRAITQNNLQTHIAQCGGANTQFYLGTKHTETLSIKIEIGNNTYEFKLAADTADACYFAEETVTFWNKRNYPKPYTEKLGTGHRETHLGESSGDPTVQSFTRDNLESWFVYHFHDTGDHSPLKRTADIDETAYLLPDGGNLAAYLYHLQKTAPDHYQGILSAIQLILPGFKEFTYRKEEKSNTVRLRWKTATSGDYPLPISAFSDGTLRFIALA